MCCRIGEKLFRPSLKREQVMHTPHHVCPTLALSRQNDFFTKSHTANVYSNYQFGCEILARVIG
jgi:hypothetical protein